MNRYVAQGDGFPGDNEFLMLIQSIIGEVANLAAIGGTNYVLKGCTVTGGNVSDGWMVLDGEIIEFEGGALGTQVTIIETVENATYLEDVNNDQQGDSKPTYFFRKAQFGTGGSFTINWSSIDKTPLSEVKKKLPPENTVLMYKGSVANIPEGWELYTPLEGKFIVGYDPNDADYGSIGEQGGEKEVTLTEAEMPQHNHSGSTQTAGAHTHKTTNANSIAGAGKPASGSDAPEGVGYHTTQSAGAHSHSFSTNNTGSGQAHENRPPYYVLAYIHYVG